MLQIMQDYGCDVATWGALVRRINTVIGARPGLGRRFARLKDAPLPNPQS